MLYFTQYKTIPDLPLSVVSLSRCITCRVKMTVFNNYMQCSHSMISKKDIAHQKNPYSYNKNPESFCNGQKHMSVLIWKR